MTEQHTGKSGLGQLRFTPVLALVLALVAMSSTLFYGGSAVTVVVGATEAELDA